MRDPIEEILNQLRSKLSVQRLSFTSKFLHTVGEVLEREGFATTRLFLMDKKEQLATKHQARVLLEDVLPILEQCERIHQNRAIGRLIIKSLETLKGRSTLS